MQSQLQLYQHSKMPDWGLAVLAWEREGRRAYQFQDGQLRIIKDGYYQLMEECEVNPREAAQVVASLRRLAGLARQCRRVIREARVSGETLITVDQQVELFLEL